jgi:uncharacterized protein YndB with AHSA1/START domain
MADAEPGLRITRVFDAPRAEVWKEWTEPRRFADWFGGRGVDVPLESVSMDVRPGGVWRATMLIPGADRSEIHWAGEYREVAAPERLVLTFTDQTSGDAYELVTVELTDLGNGRTQMDFSQTGGNLTPEHYEQAGQGWGGFFVSMAERLGEP